MKNDLNFAQNNTTLLKDQSRPGRSAPSETGSEPVIKLNRSSPKLSFRGDETDFYPVLLCPVRPVRRLVRSQSTTVKAKTEEGIGIWGEIWGMKKVVSTWEQVFSAWCLGIITFEEPSTKYQDFFILHSSFFILNSSFSILHSSSSEDA